MEHGEVIFDTLYGISIHPVTTNIQASFLTQLPERKETALGFHHEANGEDGSTLYLLHNTNLIEKKEASIYPVATRY